MRVQSPVTQVCGGPGHIGINIVLFQKLICIETVAKSVCPSFKQVCVGQFDGLASES